MITIIKSITFDNGVRLVYQRLPFVSSVSTGIWVGNGSRYENSDTNGISHFIEHMLFKGTKERNGKTIASEIDEIGGEINAFTSKERTCYYTTALKEYFDVTLDVLQDMFLNSLFDEKEIKKERTVINEEISMYNDMPDDVVHSQLQESVFSNQGLGYSVLGTKDSIGKFDHNTIVKFYNENYHQDNVVISVAGSFEEESMITKVEKAFSKWKRINEFNRENEKSKYIKSMIFTEKDIEQIHLTMAFEAYGRKNKDKYPLMIVNNILGNGMASRLFQSVREENGLAYSIFSYLNTYDDIGTLSIYAGLNTEQFEKVTALIKDEIRILKKEMITKDELEKTKIKIKSRMLLGLESSQNIMSSIGSGLLSKNKIVLPKEIAKKIDSVKLDDIERVIIDVFNFDKMSLSTVGKTLNRDFKEISENA